MTRDGTLVVGVKQDETSEMDGKSFYSWLHALDLDRFNISLSGELHGASDIVSSGVEPDVWVLLSERLRHESIASCGGSACLRSIVLVCHPSGTEIGEALAMGISSVVVLGDSPWNFAAAVHAAFDQYLFVSPAILSRYRRAIVQTFRSKNVERIGELTERERDVLAGLSRGWSNIDLSRRLHITYSTVGTHVRRILRKLDASNRTEAAMIAYTSGVVGRQSVTNGGMRDGG